MSFESSGAEYLRRLRSQEAPGIVHEAQSEPAVAKLVPAQSAATASVSPW